MGKDAQVQATFADGAVDAGRLQYEPPKLIFRGAARRVFEGADLAGVAADGRDLVLAGGARFHLPTPAKSWADAMLSPKGRLQKLGVAAGARAAIVNLNDADFAADLAAAAPLVTGDDLDLIFYGADSAADLAAIGSLLPRLAPRGALWIVSLKGKAARLKDVEVMAAARPLGLVDTKVCSFSDTRTALKFVRRR
ncbi:MAG TPA: DUF3052 domain-containing protein [Caulobacteraceae bacterium]